MQNLWRKCIYVFTKMKNGSVLNEVGIFSEWIICDRHLNPSCTNAKKPATLHWPIWQDEDNNLPHCEL